MDDTHIAEALLLTLSPDKLIREHSESLLFSLSSSPGFYEVLCRLSTAPHSLPLQQAAVLLLKNSCKSWTLEASRKLNRPQAALGDQLFLRANIIRFLVPGGHEQVRKQFLKVAKEVARNVPIREWTELLPQLDTALFTEDGGVLMAGLALLYQVVKVVCKRISSQRKPEFALLAGRYFDRLLVVLQQLPPQPPNFESLVLILKSYFKGTYIEFLEPLGADSSFKAWLRRAHELLANDPHIDGPDKQPAWDCKKWCARIAYRCISRETSLSAMSPDLKRITMLFLTEFGQGFAQLSRNLLMLSKDRRVPDVVRLYCWKYLSVAVKAGHVKAFVQSISLELFTQVILSQVCRVPQEEALWRESPIEFLHQENDIVITSASCKLAAVDFVVSLCNGGMLSDVLSFVSQLLSSQMTALIKEAVLLLFGSLAAVENLRSEYGQAVSQGLKLHVLPELQSPVGFLRFRALWTYGRFSSVPIDQDQQLQVLHSICQLLTDAELPVRVEASTTLSRVLSWSCADSLLQPEIANLIGIFSTNMELLDSEDLIDALEALVDRYSEAIVPFASGLTEKLCSTFTRTAALEEEKMTAIPVLSVLIKITSALKDHKADLHAISLLMLPILQYTLSPQGESFFEEGLNLITNLISFLDPPYVQPLYPALPLLTTALTGRPPDIQPYAFEFYEQCFNALANFIAKDKSALAVVAGKDLVVGVVRYFLALQHENVGYEYHFAAKLLMCLAENLLDFVEEQSELLMETVSFLVSRDERAWKLLGLELLSLLLSVRLSPTLMHLPSKDSVLRYWFDNLHLFKSKPAKIHTSLAFLAFLGSFEQLPELLSRNLGAVLQNLIKLLWDLRSPEDSEDSDDEEEDDSWSPIEDEMYELPWDYLYLVRTLKHALERMRELDPATASNLEAELPDKDKNTLRKLVTEAMI